MIALKFVLASLIAIAILIVAMEVAEWWQAKARRFAMKVRLAWLFGAIVGLSAAYVLMQIAEPQ